MGGPRWSCGHVGDVCRLLARGGAVFLSSDSRPERGRNHRMVRRWADRSVHVLAPGCVAKTSEGRGHWLLYLGGTAEPARNGPGPDQSLVSALVLHRPAGLGPWADRGWVARHTLYEKLRRYLSEHRLTGCMHPVPPSKRCAGNRATRPFQAAQHAKTTGNWQPSFAVTDSEMVQNPSHLSREGRQTTPNADSQTAPACGHCGQLTPRVQSIARRGVETLVWYIVQASLRQGASPDTVGPHPCHSVKTRAQIAANSVWASIAIGRVAPDIARKRTMPQFCPSP